MDLLLFSDLHADLAAARRIVDGARSADVVIGAGDFGNVRRNLRPCIDVLRAIECPAILVAGNNETTEELIAATGDWRNAHVLHGTQTAIDGVTLFGIGGAVPVTPFGSWSYDLTEGEAVRLLDSCPKRCVLVSHSPPKGCLDVSSSGQSLGSTAVRDAILRCRPLLVVCGHVHASGGQQATLGDSPVVNAGPSGITWDLPTTSPGR